MAVGPDAMLNTLMGKGCESQGSFRPRTVVSAGNIRQKRTIHIYVYLALEHHRVKDIDPHTALTPPKLNYNSLTIDQK